MDENNTLAQVSAAESEQKLLQFLVRRLQLPHAMLHRWIRTGQIRLNGHRCKPFVRVQQGDIIRLPPFAKAQQLLPNDGVKRSGTLPPLPPLLDKHGDIWAYNKPAGLPVQGGSGHKDSIAARLRSLFCQNSFTPTPAHRLDRDTTGVLLVGNSYAALRTLQTYFASGQLHKEYLCWIQGRWLYGEKLLRHMLLSAKVIDTHGNPNAKLALCKVRPLAIDAAKSLLQIRLFTGRKHQIRTQLAAEGHPIIGDVSNGCRTSELLKLHCARIILPDNYEFSCLPPWEGQFAVYSLPALFHNGSVDILKE